MRFSLSGGSPTFKPAGCESGAEGERAVRVAISTFLFFGNGVVGVFLLSSPDVPLWAKCWIGGALVRLMLLDITVIIDGFDYPTSTK